MHFIKSVIFAVSAFSFAHAVQPDDEQFARAIFARDAVAEALDGDDDELVLYTRAIAAHKVKRVRYLSLASLSLSHFSPPRRSGHG